MMNINEVYYNFLNLESSMPFGKYKGEKIKNILDKDKDYVLWLYNNMNNLRLSSDVIQALKGEKNGSN